MPDIIEEQARDKKKRYYSEVKKRGKIGQAPFQNIFFSKKVKS